jgi:hypothetical protein
MSVVKIRPEPIALTILAKRRAGGSRTEVQLPASRVDKIVNAVLSIGRPGIALPKDLAKVVAAGADSPRPSALIPRRGSGSPWEAVADSAAIDARPCNPRVREKRDERETNSRPKNKMTRDATLI